MFRPKAGALTAAWPHSASSVKRWAADRSRVEIAADGAAGRRGGLRRVIDGKHHRHRAEHFVPPDVHVRGGAGQDRGADAAAIGQGRILRRPLAEPGPGALLDGLPGGAAFWDEPHTGMQQSRSPSKSNRRSPIRGSPTLMGCTPAIR